VLVYVYVGIYVFRSEITSCTAGLLQTLYPSLSDVILARLIIGSHVYYMLLVLDWKYTTVNYKRSINSACRTAMFR